MVFYLTVQGKLTEAGEIVESFERIGDDLVDCLILDVSSNYYFTFNDLSIDYKKSYEYHEEALKLSESMTFQDRWEEAFVKIYEIQRICYKSSGQLELLRNAEKFEELIRNYPEIGDYKYLFLNNSAVEFVGTGNLDHAIKLFQEVADFMSLSDHIILPLCNSSECYYVKGDLEKSKELITLALEKSITSTNYWLKDLSLLTEARILESERKFNELEQNRINHLKFAQEYGNRVKISESFFNLFSYYIDRYKSTEERVNLNKAFEVKKDFDDLLATDPTNENIKRFNNYANALLFSLGTLRQKVRAIDIFEDLIKIYPHEPGLKLHLIELLWTDLEQDINGESKKQIDRLVEDLENSSGFHSTNIDQVSVSYQILIAKYNFYINGKVEEALESLYSLQKKALSLGYTLIEEKINKEIQALESDSKWLSVDPSLKERLDRFKLRFYMEDAQLFLNNDLNKI